MSHKVIVSAIAPVQEDCRLQGESAFRYMKMLWLKALDPILTDRPDLIVLPECCGCPGGYSQEQSLSYYHDFGRESLEFFSSIAIDNHIRIVYPSIHEMPDGTLRNSSFLIGTEGKVLWRYDKNYPMLENERIRQRILPGKTPEVFESDIGKIGALICFDLNFDPLLECYRRQKPDLLLFSSMFHGGIQENLWAFRCRTHFVSSTHVGCSVIDPLGSLIGNFHFRVFYYYS